MDKVESLGELIKMRTHEKGWSMRQLSQMIAMDTATLSRIVNGKQRASLNHLKKLAEALELSTQELLEAAGFAVVTEKEKINTVPQLGSKDYVIQDIFEFYQMPMDKQMVEKIEQELLRYESYAVTQEGSRMICERLNDKLKELSGEGPFIEMIKVLYNKFMDDSLSRVQHKIVGSGLLYFIISTDIIPDYIFPIGYLDDVIAVQIVMKKLAQCV